MSTEKKTEKKKKREKVKSIRTGIRLNTPAPRVIKSEKDYSRKKKKKPLEEESVTDGGGGR